MQNCVLGLTVRQLGELLGGKFIGLQANHVRGIVSFGAGNTLLGPSMGGKQGWNGLKEFMEWLPNSLACFCGRMQLGSCKKPICH